MRGVLRALLCAGMVALGASDIGAAETVFPSGNPDRGRRAFVDKGCLGCHSVRGAGGKTGPDLAATLVNKGLFGIAAEMWSHAPRMQEAMKATGREFPTLSEEEVRDLLSYLLFIGFTSEPGDPSKGRVVFGKKGCAKCHAFGGYEGSGPSLQQISRAVSPILIAQEMWNHGPSMAAKMSRAEVEWPTFSYGEMADLIAFLGGTSGSSEQLSDIAEIPGNPMAGRALFESKDCARCHLPGLEGRRVGPDLLSAVWYKTATEMAAVMWNHGPAMAEAARETGTAMPRFQGTEMADILAYLYLVRSGERLGDADRGRAVFSKGCAPCHETNAVGANLKSGAALDSPAHLASAMWNHAPKMQEAIKSSGLDWPRLTAADVADLLAFLVQGADANVTGKGGGK